MDLNDTLAVSVSALDAQRHRLNVIASNLANAQSTHSENGGPYKRRDVVFEATPVVPRFQGALKEAQGQNFKLTGVRVAKVIEDAKPGKVVYEPQHPDADPQGFVQMPNVNVMEEMINMMSAHRAYEANVEAVTTGRTMWLKALEIGR